MLSVNSWLARAKAEDLPSRTTSFDRPRVGVKVELGQYFGDKAIVLNGPSGVFDTSRNDCSMVKPKLWLVTHHSKGRNRLELMCMVH